MQKIILSILIILSSKIYSQQNSICHVIYRSIEDKSWTYLQWFDSSKLTFTPILIYEPKDFPVILNDGKIIHSTDTVKYRNQYHEFKIYLNKKEYNKEPISQRNYTSNVLLRHSYLESKKYLVIDTIDKMTNWQVLEDTLTILGFTCQKATTIYKNVKYIAYFTIKLPFPAGPKNYRGLPGLILKVTNDAGNAGYEAIEIEYPFKGKVPLLETDGISISKTQYQILSNEFNLKSMQKMNNFLSNPIIKPN